MIHAKDIEMPEMYHPPLYSEQPSGSIKPEQVLAEEMTQLLQISAEVCNRRIDGVLFFYPVSDRIDMVGADNSDITFRIKGFPSIHIGEISKVQAAYNVMELQYATLLDDDVDEITDESYQWKSYVWVIGNCIKTSDIQVIDCQTHDRVLDRDLAKVSYIVSLLRQEYRGADYEEELARAQFGGAASVKLLNGGKFIEFYPQDFLDDRVINANKADQQDFQSKHILN